MPSLVKKIPRPVRNLTAKTFLTARKPFMRAWKDTARPYFYHLKNDDILRNLIKGQKILIVGSGSSAEDLNKIQIPKDVKIFTCNDGISLFTSDRFNRRIDLYFYHKRRAKWEKSNMDDLIRKSRINVFCINSLTEITKKKELRKYYTRLITDYNRNNYYLQRLIKPHKLLHLRARNVWWTSVGVRLLQYALYFGAKEIYLIGIDLTSDYFWGEHRRRIQTKFDISFIKAIAEKYDNVYSLSKNSHIAKYIKYKDFSGDAKWIVPLSEEKTDDKELKREAVGNSFQALARFYKKEGLAGTIYEMRRRFFSLSFRYSGMRELMKTFQYIMVRLNSPFWHLSGDPVLKNCIEGKRILVVGSGPSAQELDRIPDDLKIFTCHRGLAIFADKGINRKIDLYLTSISKIRANENIPELLSQLKTDVFVTNDVRYAKTSKRFKGTYSRLLFFDGRDDYFLKRLIKPYTIAQIRGACPYYWTSAGMVLVQYALYFGAKEVYLIGFDFGAHRYFWGQSKRQKQVEIDTNFIKVVSQKYNNLYSLSKNSPLGKYIPHKKFE